jgi:hypothetical protein
MSLLIDKKGKIIETSNSLDPIIINVDNGETLQLNREDFKEYFDNMALKGEAKIREETKPKEPTENETEPIKAKSFPLKGDYSVDEPYGIKSDQLFLTYLFQSLFNNLNRNGSINLDNNYSWPLHNDFNEELPEDDEQYSDDVFNDEDEDCEFGDYQESPEWWNRHGGYEDEYDDDDDENDINDDED